MQRHEADKVVLWMCEVFRDINPENARIWGEKFIQPGYDETEVRQAIYELRPLCNYFDPVRLETIINRIRRQKAERVMDDQRRRQMESDSERKAEWLEIDTACDAMSDEEFNSLAQIAITVIPAWFADRIKNRNLREVRSIRAEVFKLWKMEQAA